MRVSIILGHPDPESFNEPGKKPVIVIKKKDVTVTKSGVVVPSYSVSLYRLEVR